MSPDTAFVVVFLFIFGFLLAVVTGDKKCEDQQKKDREIYRKQIQERDRLYAETVVVCHKMISHLTSILETREPSSLPWLYLNAERLRQIVDMPTDTGNFQTTCWNDRFVFVINNTLYFKRYTDRNLPILKGKLSFHSKEDNEAIKEGTPFVSITEIVTKEEMEELCKFGL